MGVVGGRPVLGCQGVGWSGMCLSPSVGKLVRYPHTGVPSLQQLQVTRIGTGAPPPASLASSPGSSLVGRLPLRRCCLSLRSCPLSLLFFMFGLLIDWLILLIFFQRTNFWLQLLVFYILFNLFPLFCFFWT